MSRQTEFHENVLFVLSKVVKCLKNIDQHFEFYENNLGNLTMQIEKLESKLESKLENLLTQNEMDRKVIVGTLYKLRNKIDSLAIIQIKESETASSTNDRFPQEITENGNDTTSENI